MTDLQKKTLCKNIKKLMIDYDMKQKELAQRIGYPEKALSRVVTGEKTPPFNMVIAIANVFGVTMDSMINSNYQ